MNGNIDIHANIIISNADCQRRSTRRMSCRGIRELRFLKWKSEDPHFLEKDFVDQLFHLNGHFEVISKLKPKSLEEIACCLAIIRPAKRHLLSKSWEEIHNQVWVKPTDGQYYFKKAHATSYAMAVIVHMNLLTSSN